VKTISLKKVSAVAVASLGFGLLSVVPAQAATSTTAVIAGVGTFTPTVPTAGTQVVIPVTYTDTGQVNSAANVIEAEFTTLPTNSSLDAQDALEWSTTGFDNTVFRVGTATASVKGLAISASTATAATSLTVTDHTSALAATTTKAVGQLVFTPDVPGKYVITTMPDYHATNGDKTITINVTGAQLIQAFSGLGTTTGTQTSGNPVSVAYTTPVGSVAGTTYKISATNLSISAITQGEETNPANANSYLGTTTGVSKNNGVDFSGGGTYVGVGTVTDVTYQGSTVLMEQLIISASSSSSFTGTGTITIATVDSVTGSTTTKATVTVTIGTTPDLSLSLSTAYMTGPSSAGADASATTNAVARTAIKTLQTGIAQVKVTLLKNDGSDDARAHTVTASVAGSGMVLVDTSANTPGTGFRSSTDSSANNIRYVHINADGTAGAGTITVTVTHAVTGVTSTLGTFKVTSYGSATKLEVSTSNFTIGLAGGDTTGAASTTRNSTGEVTNAGALNNSTTTPAFIVKATDANGNVASLGTNPTIVSSDLLVVSSGTCATDGGLDTTYSSSTLGYGYYNCSFTTASSAKSGDKATLTIRTPNPADATTYLTTTYAVTVGGSITLGTETITFDKTSYVNGEQMLITRTAKDSSGNPVADGTSSPEITFSKAVGGTSTIAAGKYKGGVSRNATSAATSTTFAPATPGAFKALATSGNLAEDSLSASASVIDANAALVTQIDALNAKIVALNALIAKIMKKLGVK
jgi:hypothetical protein